ncbi:MAG: OmpH family outer membrane protein [Planctomycetota bacterium]|nr:OmpH family outer membrane protein [Planctomycetota bacterium]
MRKLVPIAFALLTLFGIVTTPSQAGEAAPQAPETKRIGVVFIQQVFLNYQYIKDTGDEIRNTFQPETQKIDAEIQRIGEQERALQNNPLKPQDSPAWRKSMMEIQSARVDVQSMQEDFARRLREQEASLWQNAYNAFQRACKLLAEYYKYDIIIASPDPAISEEAMKAMDPMAVQQEILMRRIQFVDDKANLTKSITDLMNHRYQQYKQDPQKNPL